MAKEKGKIDIAKGISAGLLVWLGFLLCFVFLGYPEPLSIVLGAFGGVAVTWLDACLKSGDEGIDDSIIETSQDSILIKRKKIGLKEAYKKRRLKPMKTPRKSRRLMEYIFGTRR